ncbi:MAG: class I SAM-dependent methyltransferase [Phycisphaerae bacterium]
MGLAQRWHFLRGCLQRPAVVGAVAPSSQALAAALCDPFRRHPRPAAVLEVGAGTGAVTRHIGSLLGERDRLDICEINSVFAGVIRKKILTRPDFRPAVSAGRVRLVETAVQNLARAEHYDFIISGLPLTAFELRDVKEVLRVLRHSLKPGGVLSYFEYVGVRRTTRLLSVGRGRERIRLVSELLSDTIRRHQVEQRTVLKNLPPARARHLRFDR